MSERKVCPLMAAGWLANSKSVHEDVYEDEDIELTFSAENLPKCLEGDCEFWDVCEGKCSRKR